MQTDFELLDAWRAGDRSAGNALFERYFDAICRFFANKVHHGIDDLIQKTFLGCVEGRDRFQKQASFRTYLFAVAHNVLRAHFRQTRPGVDFDPSEVAADDFTPSPSTMFALQQEQRLLLEALRRIPLDHQLVLELYYWEDMAAPELAAVLGVPEGTVRSRLRRAKEALAEKMASLARSPELLKTTLSDLEKWVRSLRAQIDGS
ncbi:MAG: sigma-70 family RNA polymerase sigma factor [Myxococcales bacterium]|nr:sigma-70 family RNA polymerase sigma factor [Myxococcales bacterium]